MGKIHSMSFQFLTRILSRTGFAYSSDDIGFTYNNQSFPLVTYFLTNETSVEVSEVLGVMFGRMLLHCDGV